MVRITIWCFARRKRIVSAICCKPFQVSTKVSIRNMEFLREMEKNALDSLDKALWHLASRCGYGDIEIAKLLIRKGTKLDLWKVERKQGPQNSRQDLLLSPGVLFEEASGEFDQSESKSRPSTTFEVIRSRKLVQRWIQLWTNKNADSRSRDYADRSEDKWSHAKWNGVSGSDTPYPKPAFLYKYPLQNENPY